MASTSRIKGTRTPRVLVVCKKSSFQIYVRERKNPRIKELLTTDDPSMKRLVRAHEEHTASIAAARKVLVKLGANAVFRYRHDAVRARAFDLLVTLGGDGTLLWASHLVGSDCAVVAINTAPSDSVGHFCAGTMHDLESVLEDALAGRLKRRRLSRMRVEVDGRLISARVLNEALFCHKVPAATSRYAIQLGRRKEEHKSSGVWVGPGAGSTAAQRAAGGLVFSATSRRLQFVVRELSDVHGDRPRLRSGFVKPGESLRIRSRIRSGRLYLDGPHLVRTVEIGSELRVRLSDEPLTLLGFVPRRGARR
jgi:NAD+ kinase